METQVVDGEERFLVFFLELLPTQTNAINHRGVLLRFWSDERPRAAVALGKIENHGLALHRIGLSADVRRRQY